MVSVARSEKYYRPNGLAKPACKDQKHAQYFFLADNNARILFFSPLHHVLC